MPGIAGCTWLCSRSAGVAEFFFAYRRCDRDMVNGAARRSDGTEFSKLGRDAALRRQVGAARRLYHGSAFRQFYANVCNAR